MASIIISRMTAGRCRFTPVLPPPYLWPHNSTKLVPGILPELASPSTPPRPRVIQGCLYFQVSGVLFPTFAQAAIAWLAAEARRLGIADKVETLVVERTGALAEMRKAGADMARFSAACEREAELAVRTRQLRVELRHG